MRKYVKKSEIVGGDVVVMEVSHIGVRTRAKTLALQRLQAGNGDSASFSYLQLRNRRLEKVRPLHLAAEPKSTKGRRCRVLSPNPNCRERVVSSSVGSVELRCRNENGEMVSEGSETEAIEAFIGDNNFDCESGERSRRESTPCSLLSDTDIIRFQGSNARKSYSTAANKRIQSNLQRNIPTVEIEEFFSCIEHQQQKLFIEKYNYDFANDRPFTGRYEWVQLIP